ncbi:MAG: zinc ribbon domain-containing protein [Ruminococcus sp.]|nr:zinc ribbon domain-containing protein [Ruminococcus sp.]
MAFMDDIGKKIGMAGQTAAQKAMVMTDVARLSADIAEEEKKIDNVYVQVGKLYISMHAEEWDKEFDGMVAAIRESEFRIKSYRERIQTIKGVVRCERCGAEVANTAAFCNACGAAMPRKVQMASQENVRICPKCGTRIGADNLFCTECGQKLN